VVATPRGQLHELGALLVAATAGSEGWRVTYLGPSLPADEIATAAVARQARAVALSIVFPCDDATLADELAELRHRLGEAMPLLCGGRGAEAYRPALERADALHLPDLGSFRDFLARLREPNAISAAGAPLAPGS
jgi:methylmalonyl-CoA mutase cobalamin-binding subunit